MILAGLGAENVTVDVESLSYRVISDTRVG